MGKEMVHTCQASKTCPGGHGFDVRDGRQTPNIETMPIWAFFRCSAGRDVVDRIVNKCQASKPCPSGHFFDVQRVKKGEQMLSIETMPR